MIDQIKQQIARLWRAQPDQRDRAAVHAGEWPGDLTFQSFLLNPRSTRNQKQKLPFENEGQLVK